MGRRVGVATKAVVAAGAALAAGFVIAKVKEAVTDGLDYASALGEQATQLGVTAKALQEYRFAGTQVGIEQEQIDKGLQKLSLTLGKLSSSTDKQKEAFVKYGLTAADVNKLSQSTAEEALPLLADKFAALTSPTEKAALAAEFFGSKLGAKFNTLLEGGSKGVNELTQAANDLGIVLSDKQIQDADNTADKIAALNTVLQAKIAGAVSDNADSILELVNALIKLIEYAGKGVRALRIFNDMVSRGKSAERAALDDLGPGVQLTFDPAELTARRLGGGAVSAPQFLRKPVAKRNVFKPGAARFAANDIDIQAGRNTAALSAFDKAADSAAGKASDRLAPALTKLSAEAKKSAEAMKELAEDGQNILDRLFPREAADRQYEVELKTLDELLKRNIISLDRFNEARRRLSIDSLGGNVGDDVTSSIFDNVEELVPDFEKLNNSIGKIKGLYNANADAVEVANVRIVKSFADMAQETLSSLQTLTNSIKGGGFLNILSAVVGFGLQLGSIGAFGKGIAGKINLPGRAFGGPVSSGRTYLVGERGPELFQSGTSGRIISNDNLRGGGNTRVDVIPSPFFQVAVNGQIQRAAPALVGASVAEVGQRQSRAQSRRVG